MTVVARPRHDEGVQRLLDSYRAIPTGEPVRLAKRTSNLFRPRDATRGTRAWTRPGSPGSSPSTRSPAPPTSRGCAPTSTSSTPRSRTASRRSSCPSCARSRSAARSPGWASSRPRGATGCRTSRSLEMDVLTGAGEVVTTDPDTRHPDLFRGFPNSYGTLGYATRLRIGWSRWAARSRCATCGSTTSTSWSTLLGRGRRRRRSTTASRSTTSTASCSPPTRVLPRPRAAHRRARARPATTPVSRSTTARSSTTTRPGATC